MKVGLLMKMSLFKIWSDIIIFVLYHARYRISANTVGTGTQAGKNLKVAGSGTN